MSATTNAAASTFSGVQPLSADLNIKPASKSDTLYHIVLLSGSFNPVHAMHVQLLIEAKKHLLLPKDNHKATNTVVLGVLAPSSEQYVRDKMRRLKSANQAWTLKQRVDMCKLAIIDMKQQDWMRVCEWGWASGPRIASELETQFHKRYFGKQSSCRSNRFVVHEIGGVDFALRASKFNSSGRPFICFARAGDTLALEQLKKSMAQDEDDEDDVEEEQDAGGKGDVKRQLPHKHANFELVESTDVVQCSSTEIRRALSSKNVAALQALVDAGKLPTSVREYLVAATTT